MLRKILCNDKVNLNKIIPLQMEFDGRGEQ